MGIGGGAIILCSLFFLYVAHPVCPCSEMSQHFCNKGQISNAPDSLRCGGHLFQCKDSTMEIQFGGRGPWYRVVREYPIYDGPYYQFEIEDPSPNLVSNFTAKGCDFICSFHDHQGPPFLPFQTWDNPPHRFRSLNCNKFVSSYLFPELHDDVHVCTASDLSHPSNTTFPGSCPGPFTQKHPGVVIWKLSMEWRDDGSVSVTVVSLSFCRPSEDDDGGYHHPPPDHAEDREHHHTPAKLIIGVSIGAGLLVLASFLFYLWCRRKMTKTAPTSSTTLLQSASPERPLEEDLEMASIDYPTQVFQYEELLEATNGFSRSYELDRGGHGTVYRGKLRDGRTVAVKRIYENICKRAEQFVNEIAILSCLHHPNLVALYGCTSRHSRELLLVYEFIPNGTIADHLHGHRAAQGTLTWPLRLRIAVETATALAYLHAVKPQIIHRDVKTKNILLDGDFHVKVADFGLSRLFPMAASHVSTVPQGTPGYVDPEYHRCFQLTDKSDVYSFGVVLAELISSKPAVDVTRPRHEINLSNMALNKIQNGALQELVDTKLGFFTNWEVRRSIEEVAELAMRCLQGEGDLRPAMECVLKVLQEISDGLHRAKDGGEANHMVGDAMELQENCAPTSLDSVMSGQAG